MPRVNLVVVAIAALFSPCDSVACLWDRDTLYEESQRYRGGIIDTITGRFPRNPPEYYEARLQAIASVGTPLDLSLFDDAAVACDRLGRQDEAIAWMERKRERLEALDAETDEWREHRYRYLANLGTFHIHRWLKNGADRDRMEDVVASRKLIAEAIELNPDAHFGREKYQLKAIEWILNPPSIVKREPDDSWIEIPTILGEEIENPSQAKEAIDAIRGLIVLGAAWESVDLFVALQLALKTQGDASLAYLAGLRWQELVANGRTLLHPDAPLDSEELASALHMTSMRAAKSGPENTGELEAYYTKARASAENWHRLRNDYALKRLMEGRHPDTEADFWSDFQDPPAVKLPGSLDPRQARKNAARPWFYGALGVGIVAALAAGVLSLRVFRRRSETQ